MNLRKAVSTIAIYQSVNGLWYWRCVAKNGKIGLDGAEGYASKSNAKRAARRVKAIITEAVELK